MEEGSRGREARDELYSLGWGGEEVVHERGGTANISSSFSLPTLSKRTSLLVGWKREGEWKAARCLHSVCPSAPWKNQPTATATPEKRLVDRFISSSSGSVVFVAVVRLWSENDLSSPSVDPVPSFAPSLALPTDGGSPRRQLRRPRPGVPPARLGHFPASHAGPSLPCVPLTGQHRGHSQRRQRRQRSLIGNGGWAMLGPRPSPPSCSSSFFQPGRDGSERGAQEREMDGAASLSSNCFCERGGIEVVRSSCSLRGWREWKGSE